MNRPPIGRHALRRGRVSDAGRLYFVTKVTRQRVPARWPAARRVAAGPLLQPGVPEIVLGSLAWLQDHTLVTLVAYCVMPDHIHVLFQLGFQARLSNVMQRFGSFTGLQVYRLTGRGHLWQDGYQDHALRDETPIPEVVRYIEYNPVAAGLVAHPAAWPWVSRVEEADGAPDPAPGPA